MKTFQVTQREILVTVLQVEAEDEEDAIEIVQSGDGFLLEKYTETYTDQDEWEVVEGA